MEWSFSSGSSAPVRVCRSASERPHHGARRTVSGVEQGTGEGSEVENLLSLAEGFDLDRAERDCTGVSFFVVEQIEGGDDLGEMVAATHQHGDLPGSSTARWQGFREPFAGDTTDLEGVAAGLLLFELGGRGRIGVRFVQVGRDWVDVPDRAACIG